jgi:hypothetical protein
MTLSADDVCKLTADVSNHMERLSLAAIAEMCKPSELNDQQRSLLAEWIRESQKIPGSWPWSFGEAMARTLELEKYA